MNERIEELFKETNLHRNDHTTEQRRAEVEKFAKLIVQECQKVADKYISDCGEVASLPEYVFHEHFGVK